MQDLIKDYPVVIEMPIAWGDMDAFQHVNNIIPTTKLIVL
jgi:acyl-CoA thioester hydrolase